MKMMTKKIVMGFFLISFISCKSQISHKLTFEKLRVETIDFLLHKKEVTEARAEKLKSGEFSFILRGVNNNLAEGDLKNGMYAFSLLDDHCRGYFLIVENDSHIILDIGTRTGLDEAIKNTLDFCERNKFCVDITNDYVSRLIGVYYNINKNPLNGHDINCEKGVKEINELP